MNSKSMIQRENLRTEKEESAAQNCEAGKRCQKDTKNKNFGSAFRKEEFQLFQRREQRSSLGQQ